MYIEAVAILAALFLTPILAVLFSFNLVAVIKKTHNNEKTTENTFWIIFSFT
ncbi:hypothetical protein [Alkalibacillus haloalkaliphilus]|uniref:Uncharacterized protein n=1 Tax=Alkalibacillus haloalkaliphilus TaxID=94136 RepID=A0A511W065_9BACI|nr:hypothetical protein [Alkalibacillus haloalkaliphilus]GEN44446.1 hypothetical protein AHA02nite_02220 [Alkalibacillus haloalkaliphilus]